ncbi:hypothetical protein [Sandaracinus amylolyticus]|uniref:hypothetical protein n=1 Tax=Sandaracinus amylolyticus TaxID=927083 RepID=UPI001F29DD0F|nr:hypothetical protein [Sandaracinus amylolyticus]UJR81766.1 Hypothetical protein I5071_38260 [Sandaracinus amylolyticus]
MTDRRASLLGLGWGEIRALAPTRASNGASHAILGRSELHRTSAAWWPRGAIHEIVVRPDAEVWVHVVAGELALERWARDDEGAWRDEGTRALAGQSLHLRADALHRLTAHRASSVIVVSSPPDAIDETIDRPLLSMLRRARDVRDESAPGSSTAVGCAAPALDGEPDA